MKLIHLSDLHIGKRMKEYSLIEDQEYILKEILGIIDKEKPDAVIIAGDIYDKSVPSAEAVELFDNFLVSLAKRQQNTFIISGNHDSPERLAFGNRLIDVSGIHISPVYKGQVEPFEIEDDYGKAYIYMLPYIKPVNVRAAYPEETIESYADAVKVAIDKMNISKDKRNILITHQFVTGAVISDSEELSVGGADNIDASVFKDFDYVALGHIHGPQNIGTEKIRYCGSPLKYSASEAEHKKSVTVVELKEKGVLSIREEVLVPKRDVVILKGKYEELTAKSFYEGTTYQEDYTFITLTDEDDINEGAAKLRTVYHNMMQLDYDNIRTRHHAEINGAENIESKTQLELFSDFYILQNGTQMSEQQIEFLRELIDEVWEEEK